MKRSAGSGRTVPSWGVALVAFAGALALVGCKTVQSTQSNEATHSIGVVPTSRAEADVRRSARSWGERYHANPHDPEAAIKYALALRGNGQRSQAVAVLEQASIHTPHHMGVLGAYGRALAGRAHTPENPDWRILSAQGAVLDQMGHHGEAQRYYATALRLRPDEPSVLSNLGLSYALSKDLVRAETTLRRAAGQSRADLRVRQNLALVVGLQGRFAEAEGIARADLLSEEATGAKVAYLRQMLAQQNGWKGTPGKPVLRAEGS
jgi:Flp pilus assembly protein TadD